MSASARHRQDTTKGEQPVTFSRCKRQDQYNTAAMFKNYFKTAFRNCWKNKTSFAINVIGLTIGMTSSLLIAMYILHETSYDNFQLKGNRIVRMIMGYKFDGGDELKKGNFTSVRVATVFKKTFPEVENAVKMYNTEKVVGAGDRLFTEKKFMYADPSFFNIFSFRILQGNAASALTAPHQVLLTLSTAKKYFGSSPGEYSNAIGKALRVGNDTIPYQVAGIIQDCPSNSQIKFDFLASFSSMNISKDREDSYWDANYTTYLLLRNGNDQAKLQAKIAPFMKQEMSGKGATVVFDLELFRSIHLHSAYDGFEPNNSITYIYILGAVAVLILVIVCFTYINLSTARSLERAKEVGIRKVIGAGKKQLFWQFMGESLLVCLIAVVVSIVLALLTLPWFNQLSEKQLQANQLFSLPLMMMVLVITVCVSLLAGSYPALILSGFQPVKVLKGAFKNTDQAQWLRKSLIVFQFTVSILLIVSTFIIQRQLYFIQHTKLGYNRDHVLLLPMDGKIFNNLATIKQEFSRNADVISVSGGQNAPVYIMGGYNMRSATMPDNQYIAVAGNPIDENYVKTNGLQLIAGEDLSERDMKEAQNKDETKLVFHLILNESAVAELGWTPQQAIGQKMFFNDAQPGYVRGVVKDFHFESLHQKIKPLILFPATWGGRTLMVKMSGFHLPQTISFLENKWKLLVPHRPFDYRFMDEDYNKLYNSEQRLGKVMKLFAGIAIVLACMGLFGLSSYAAQQRIKEIGVRKVLGASVFNLWTLLSKDSLWLVTISFLIATPLGYYAMQQWLLNYEYRAALPWWIFAGAGLGALFVTILTVSFQSIRAALMNPVKALRTE